MTSRVIGVLLTAMAEAFVVALGADLICADDFR